MNNKRKRTNSIQFYQEKSIFLNTNVSFIFDLEGGIDFENFLLIKGWVGTQLLHNKNNLFQSSQ